MVWGVIRGLMAKQAIPTIAVFVASGLFHELLLFINFGTASGEQLAFFIIHAVALLVQRAWPVHELRAVATKAVGSEAAATILKSSEASSYRRSHSNQHVPAAVRAVVRPVTRGMSLGIPAGGVHKPQSMLESEGQKSVGGFAFKGEVLLNTAARMLSVLTFQGFLGLTLVIFFAPWFRRVRSSLSFWPMASTGKHFSSLRLAPD